MSALGFGHTLISVVALIVAAVSLFKEGAINPFSRRGKQYSVLTAIACISAFALSFSKGGGFNPGHVLGILILVLLGVAYLLSGRKAGSVFSYVVLFCMSTTVFLSLIPGINETLTRLPVGHPIAEGPTSPIVQKTLVGLLVLFVAGLTMQFVRQRREAKGK